MRNVFTFALSVLAVLALAACGTPASMTTSEQAPAVQPAAGAVTVGTLTINDPWVRPANPAAEEAMEGHAMGDGATPAATGEAMGEMGAMVNTGGYMTITNSGTEADYLVAATASSDLFGTVELHTVIEEGGVMKMRPVEKIEVPANGEVVLKPGSFHVMFIGVKQELKPGDMVKVSLTFEQAGTVEIDAVVRPAS